ncbi:hypothetical protein GGU45_003783 [Niabella hirudinis]
MAFVIPVDDWYQHREGYWMLDARCWMLDT